MTSTRGGLIDTHQHAMPAAVKKMLVDRGLLPPVDGPPFANWELGAALDTMDACGIEMGILSAPIPSEFLGDEAFATAITRAANEGIADVVRDHPGRFGLLAYLPLPYVDAALEEIAYAFDTLGADGVIIGSHAGDSYLGDAAFDKVLAELDRRRAVVLTHPFNLPSCGVTPLPPFLADFMLDTTRAAIALITSGTLERCPGISFVLPHAGGFLPYSAARLGLATFLGSGVQPDQISGALKRFHYDTAGPMSPYATPSLLAAAGPERILYGSDYNAVPRPGIAAGVSALRADPALDAAASRRIERDNALALFPRLARRLDAAPAGRP
jgi:6-methylsalicylate decarboxylase